MEINQTLMENLLEQHQKQTQATTQETERRIEKSTKELYERYKTLFSSVDSLKQKLNDNNDTVETIKQAISSSSSVGYVSETILENTLKSFGLHSDQDFFTQMSVNSEDGGKLRPDAVVLLPDNNALIVDSKASKFIYLLAEAEKSGDTETIQTAKNNLKNSMNNHLNSLTKKDYANAIMAEMKRMGEESTLNNITVIMWLPNDAAVEKVNDCDSSFTKRAGISNVLICGPSALWVAICIASQKIRLDKQSKNHIKIVEESEKLLGYIATIVEAGKKVKRGLMSANKAWEQFSTSFDARFISSAKRIEKLGVKPSKPIQYLGNDNSDDILEVDINNREIKEIEE